eukprot:CAMPEP_0181171888 /NCGR_PEP_ID=MMETSP1096-20121128/2154_1 /TAXON_ID=156174 ORGANISM="Chrysochromulina ericina, Strain CCMP281" /NCGR_SAMPLE_ID=MMETSP1096 /ASSEMBLY_ACC=CAM_ASM_000453 /LENGTH=81 /DNA_ID=CAMNT_0023259575 /DNA_START=248 /DNA_END=494 /DNA_ORIENTATION=-
MTRHVTPERGGDSVAEAGATDDVQRPEIDLVAVVRPRVSAPQLQRQPRRLLLQRQCLDRQPAISEVSWQREVDAVEWRGGS